MGPELLELAAALGGGNPPWDCMPLGVFPSPLSWCPLEAGVASGRPLGGRGLTPVPGSSLPLDTGGLGTGVAAELFGCTGWTGVGDRLCLSSSFGAPLCPGAATGIVWELGAAETCGRGLTTSVPLLELVFSPEAAEAALLGVGGVIGLFMLGWLSACLALAGSF